jgi:SAM-dependent methyltransferase
MNPMWSVSRSSNTQMKTILSRRRTCRLCEGHGLELIIQLTPTPLANAFVSSGRLSEVQDVYPLDLFLCNDCSHVQLIDVIDPKLLFHDYIYVSSTSPVFVEHFRRYADQVLARLKPAQGALVVEIGSNDGILLTFFRHRGMRVLGVDPARHIAQTATESGIETLPTFFTAALSRKIRQERGSAAIVAANNVLAHVDDLTDMVIGIHDLLTPDGIFVFEVSYLVDVIQKTLFDTVYHEHLCYHSVKPLRAFFHRHGLELIDTERVATHGGSLRGTVQLAGGPHSVSPSVASLIAFEEDLGLYRAQTFTSFATDIDKVRASLGTLLRDLKLQGKTIAGYGAPAKATTLLYHFDLGNVLDYIVDDSPLKQNMFTPGHHIPVVSAQAIYDRKPDYLLILAWNFAHPIMKKHQLFLHQGGHFIVPLPDVKVV